MIHHIVTRCPLSAIVNYVSYKKNSTGSLSLIDPLPFPFLDGKKVKKSACTLDKGFGRQQKSVCFFWEQEMFCELEDIYSCVAGGRPVSSKKYNLPAKLEEEVGHHNKQKF